MLMGKMLIGGSWDLLNVLDWLQEGAFEKYGMVCKRCFVKESDAGNILRSWTWAPGVVKYFPVEKNLEFAVKFK